MGNVHASGINVGVPPPPSPTSPTTNAPDTSSKTVGSKPTEDKFTSNPGSMEELHKKCKDIFPVIFEGGKFILNKPLSNHFQVSHAINFSSIQPPGYKFSVTYVGTQEVSPSESYPVMMGELDPSGNLNANLIHQINPFIKAKFVAQIQQGKWQTAQLATDFRGRNYTASLTLANIDVLRSAGIMVGHYLHRATPQLDIGAEIAYQYGPQVPGGGMAVHSLAARYSGDDFTASSTVGLAGFHLCYFQKASDTLQIGVELETSLRLQESTASVAYQVEIPKANFTFRGTLDSNWTVGAVLEKKLMPLPFTFALSALLNHPKNQFKIGCGFIVG